MTAFVRTASQPMTNPLEGTLKGLRVLDFSQIAAGPLCTMFLGDMGAEVVKVEPPEGDVARKLGPPFVNGESTLFLSLNRNKRSIVCDLKTEDGRQRAHRLIDGADVLVESFRPGVAERLGVGFADSRERNPRLIYCSISAFGQAGPWAKKPGVDGALQAVSGLMSITGTEGQAPSKLQTPVVDMAAGYHATIAILSALQMRQSGHVPDRLDVSLFAAALMLQQIPLAGYLMSAELPLRTGSGAPYATPNEAYETSDGHILVAAYQEAHWRKFCVAIDRPQLADDARFRTLSQRMNYRVELCDEINAALRHRTTAEWVDVLAEFELICAPVANYCDVVKSPQFAASGIVTSADHSVAGSIAMPGFAIGGRSAAVASPPPLLGEHNDCSDWRTWPAYQSSEEE